MFIHDDDNDYWKHDWIIVVQRNIVYVFLKPSRNHVDQMQNR